MSAKRLILVVLLFKFFCAYSSQQDSDVFDCKKYKENTVKLLESGKSAIGYDLSGGRFGDCLVCYLHAKWICYKYNLPLLYFSFEYSSELVLSDAELSATVGNSATLKRENPDDQEPITHVLFEDTNVIRPDAGVLYLVPWAPESLQQYENIENGRMYLFVNWDDENFMKDIRALISPKAKLKLLELPNDKVTVAVHVRRSSNGFDLSLSFDSDLQDDKSKQFLDDFYPFKCVNDDFYISSIKLLHDLFPNKPMYVYIFTDDKDSEFIVKKYKKSVNNSNITFDCRHEKHDHTTHVLEDFFSMLKFDCLIRSDSNFSLIASKLGDFKYVISPAGYQIKNGHPVISSVNITTKIVKEMW